VYNRIDGPGSSLDLKEFQESLWSLPVVPENAQTDPTMVWTRSLPRTIGITVDTGTRVTALPFEPDGIAVQSVEYGTDVVGKCGSVHPSRENWLLKIVDLFSIAGVKFVLRNLRQGIHSSGLGGSASATTGVCILANELAGRPFSKTQLVSMASRMEQDLGVSITGTQEQSNVVFGGVTDYVWFPWGVPGRPESGYGESIRTELIPPADYSELESRMVIVHTGKPRASADVNTVWRDALFTNEGFHLHAKKLAIAYQFREGLRLRKWERVLESIDDYRQIRTALCGDYMTGAIEILSRAQKKGCTAFPLGAGGGGGVLVFSDDPQSIMDFRIEIDCVYPGIAFRIRETGHELFNVPLDGS
jgi:mevalonate kinase